MAACRQCGSGHIDILERRSGLCASCYEAGQRGDVPPAHLESAAAKDNSSAGEGMLLLFALALLTFCAAGLSLLIALFQEDLGLLVLSVTCAVSGVLFLALNRIIAALEAIRDALAPKPEFPPQVAVRQGLAEGHENAKTPQDHP